jgi:hypothetical protein
MMRAVFIAVPALIVAAVPAAFDPKVGAIVFGAVFLLGAAVTQPRPERGEF